MWLEGPKNPAFTWYHKEVPMRQVLKMLLILFIYSSCQAADCPDWPQSRLREETKNGMVFTICKGRARLTTHLMIIYVLKSAFGWNVPNSQTMNLILPAIWLLHIRL